MVALFGVHLRDALERQVIGLGGAAGEDDLLVGRADQGCHLLAGLLHRLLGLPAEAVIAAGGVAEMFVKYGRIASNTRGSTGVVAWLSM